MVTIWMISVYFCVFQYGVKKVEGFSWGNCGSASDPIVISSLSLQPDPLHIPGDITLSFNATLRTAVQAPIKVRNIS